MMGDRFASVRSFTGTIRHYSEFSGCGGTSAGASAVPGVETIAAANHNGQAIDSHRLNFPNAEHFQEDLTKLDVDKMPYAELFTASPACPAWTDANGVRRDFDRANAELTLFDIPVEEDPKEAKRREEYRRSRLLMKEVPRYLRAQADRGRPVPIGWVENVVQCRLWSEWDDWLREFRTMGYKTELIAMNSMHARPVATDWAPQSRDRLYLAYWHTSIGRDPDWDKWLRPEAWCARCDRVVSAIRIWKQAGVDMGDYRAQYIYRCPAVTCATGEVFPAILPALAAIDPTLPGTRIGDRAALGMRDLADNTMGRIAAGVRRYWVPLLVPVGRTWRGKGDQGAQPLDRPMPTRTTRECDGVAVPPLLVPVEGRDGKTATSAARPIRTQTTRNETGLAMPTFVIPMRGGGDREKARLATDPLHTVTASGNHHGVALPPLVMRNNTARGGSAHLSTPATEPMRTLTTSGHQSLLTWEQQLIVPYYGNSGSATPASQPVGTIATRAHHGVASLDDFNPREAELSPAEFAALLDDVMFRMLEPHEIGRAMAFRPDYQLSPTSKRDKVRLFGNAVTPPVAEIITSALVECLTGEDLPRELTLAGVS